MNNNKYSFFISLFIDEIQKPKYKYFRITTNINDKIDNFSIYTFANYFPSILEKENPKNFRIILDVQGRSLPIFFTKDSGILLFNSRGNEKINNESIDELLEKIKNKFENFFN